MVSRLTHRGGKSDRFGLFRVNLSLAKRPPAAYFRVFHCVRRLFCPADPELAFFTA